MRTLAHALAIAGNELRIEGKRKEITISTLLFASLVVLVSSFSFYIDPNLSRSIAAGVLWDAIAFSGVLAMSRSWERERELSVFFALWSSPAPRVSIYLGKVLSTFLFLLIVEAVLLPTVALFLQVDLLGRLPLLTLLLLLGTLGFVAAGNLFASMAVRTRNRELMLSCVLFPLIAPSLLSAVVATREVFALAPWSEIVDWLRILVAFDLLFLGLGVMLFETLHQE